MPRKTEGCLNCGEIREIAAHGLCFKCYRRDERAVDSKFVGVDRHDQGIRREHKKLFRGFTNVMVGLSDLGVSNPEVLRIRRIIDAYLRPIAKFLIPSPAQDEAGDQVNNEQRSGFLFTVHTGADVNRPYSTTNADEVTERTRNPAEKNRLESVDLRKITDQMKTKGEKG